MFLDQDDRKRPNKMVWPTGYICHCCYLLKIATYQMHNVSRSRRQKATKNKWFGHTSNYWSVIDAIY